MKKWKQAASAVLLATFVMTGALPAMAAPDGNTTQLLDAKDVKIPAGHMQEADAIAKAKAMFGDLKELPFVNANYSERYQNREQPVWSVMCNEKDPSDWKENQDPPNYLQVTFDAKTGDVLMYNREDRSWTGSAYPSKDLAISTATEFMKKIAPSLYPKLTKPQVNGQSGGVSMGANGKEFKFTSSSVSFFELVNGIPFQSNSVSVQVDQFGHVTSFWRDFKLDSSKLPKPEQAISKAEATVAFQKKFSMSKSYITRPYFQGKDGAQYKNTPALTINPDDMYAIDAITGNVWDAGMTNPFQNQNHSLLTVEGQGQTLKAKDKEDAKRLIGELFQTDLSKLIFEERKDQGQIQGRDMWDFMWHEDYNGTTMAGNRQPLSINGSFDAKTGELMSAGIYGGDVKQDSKLAFTLEEGRVKALDFLKAHMLKGSRELMSGAMYDEATINTTPAWYKATDDHYMTAPHRYSYVFYDTHQGLAIGDRTYQATLDPATGRIESLSLPSFAEVTLPDNKDTMDLNVAEATFLQNHPLQLTYVWADYHGQPAPQGNLLWTVDPSTMHYSYIDAFTGYEISLDQTN